MTDALSAFFSCVARSCHRRHAVPYGRNEFQYPWASLSPLYWPCVCVCVCVCVCPAAPITSASAFSSRVLSSAASAAAFSATCRASSSADLSASTACSRWASLSLHFSAAIALLALLRRNALLFGESLPVELFLLFLRLLFEHVPLDVRTFSAPQHTVRARPWLPDKRSSS